MELILLNKDFQAIGMIDSFSSLQWERKYYDVGSFELHTTPAYFEMIRHGRYIYRADAAETGVIETIIVSEDTGGNKDVVVKGKFLELLLKDRVVERTITLSGTGEDVIRTLVSQYAISPANSSRKIPRLSLGHKTGIGEPIEMQVTGSSIYDKIYEICLAQQISFSIVYDYLSDDLVFSVWQGKDRTQDQLVNSFAVFSTNYANVLASEFLHNETEYKNFAYVAGEGEDANRVIVEVDQTNGEERRELYVDAKDLRRKQDDGTTLTVAKYREVLYQRGLEKLAEYKREITVDSVVDINANLIYKQDFDLGDLCTYIDFELGIEIEQRITEIIEVYEPNSQKVSVAFGDQLLTVMQKIKREVT